MPTLKEVTHRVRELRNSFVPPASATGKYSTTDYDRTKAFILLAHAEIEGYLESRVRSIADRSVKAWSLDSKPRAVVLALVAYRDGGGATRVPSERGSGKSSIREVVDSAKAAHSGIVANNNGIKEINLLELVIPVGVRESDLSVGFVGDLNSLGSLRGDHAHNSIGAKTPPDPVDSLALIVRVLKGFRRLEVVLRRLELE